jgi:hypothetical protein
MKCNRPARRDRGRSGGLQRLTINLTRLPSGDSLRCFNLGGLAQLGERLAGSQKVKGSSPLSSIFGRGADKNRAGERRK